MKNLQVYYTGQVHYGKQNYDQTNSQQLLLTNVRKQNLIEKIICYN